MCLSEEQTQDLLYLRRLYITRRSVLHGSRQVTMNGACMGGQDSLHPHADLDHFASLGKLLQETAMQECKAYHQLCHAVFKGVSSAFWDASVHLLGCSVCSELHICSLCTNAHASLACS